MDAGVGSAVVARMADVVTPSSVDLAIPGEALKVRSGRSSVLGRSSVPQVPWVGRVVLSLGQNGEGSLWV